MLQFVASPMINIHNFNMLIVQAIGVNFTKLCFSSYFKEVRWSVFPCHIFQASLIFMSKAGVYPSGASYSNTCKY